MLHVDGRGEIAWFLDGKGEIAWFLVRASFGELQLIRFLRPFLQAGDDNVRLPGGPKRPQPLNHTALMSMFNEVRHLELRNSTSDRDTFAILRAYSLLGDAEAARRIFFFRRSLKHPIVTSNFDSHIDDDLTLYLRSMTTVSARKGTRDDGRLAVHLNESFFDSKYRPAQVMADMFKIIKVRGGRWRGEGARTIYIC